MPAPPSSEQTASALVHAAVTLADVMAAEPAGPVWLVDAGRLSARSPALPFGRAADHVVVVTSGSFPALQLVPHRVDALRVAGCAVSVVVVEPTSWSAAEVADFVTADVVAVLPWVTSRGSGIAAMGASAWRPWWRRVEDAAAYLAATEAPVVAPDHRVRP